MPSLDKFRLFHVVSFLCTLFLVVQVLKMVPVIFRVFFCFLSCYRIELSASKMSKSVLVVENCLECFGLLQTVLDSSTPISIDFGCLSQTIFEIVSMLF